MNVKESICKSLYLMRMLITHVCKNCFGVVSRTPKIDEILRISDGSKKETVTGVRVLYAKVGWFLG